MNIEYKIKQSILKVNGLCKFSNIQLDSLSNSREWIKMSVKKESLTYNYLKDQYYPQFRGFMSNAETNNISNIFFRNLVCDSPTKNMDVYSGEKKLTIVNSPDFSFWIRKVELYLFNTGIGIYSLDILIDNPEGDIFLFSNFINKIRNFNVLIKTTDNKEYSLLKYTENLLNEGLNLARNNSIRIVNEPTITEFSGSKFKIFQVLDLQNKSNETKTIANFDSLLFELGTVSPIGSASNNNHIYSPSPTFFEETMEKNKISIFKNWQALCLFDSFTMIGHDYLDEAYEVWEQTYFKIYVFNLFFKYHLYLMNTIDLDYSNLDKERNSFHEFLNHFDLDYISYNFLPNTIHKKIKHSLQIEEETAKLYKKIERINILINERSTKNMNMLLLLLAILAIIPSTFEGLDDFKTDDIERVNVLFTITKIILVAAILVFFYFRKPKV